ncbi:MAG: 6-bladed beta-propeller [Bacteroidales bacterium]|nr:6-bladed beta-propeller [Bacteroidales bacterium]
MTKALLLTLVVLSTACQSNHNTQPKDLRIIDVEGGVGKGRLVKLSEIAESIEYIPLETNSEAVVGKIFADRIFYEKDCFYLMERSISIIIFDRCGQYLNKISKYGRGPQEYDAAFTVDFDLKTGNISVLAYN